MIKYIIFFQYFNSILGVHVITSQEIEIDKDLQKSKDVQLGFAEIKAALLPQWEEISITNFIKLD